MFATAPCFVGTLARPEIQHRPPPSSRGYPDLVGAENWARLPLRTRTRFLCRGGFACYRGRIVESQCSTFGRLLRQLGRLAGGPLPLDTATGPAAVVVMTVGDGNHAWTRLYRRRRGRPQAIRSIKRFRGHTGLEEYLGGGICIALRMRVEGRSLVFESDGYCIAFGNRRLRIPDWLSPGRLCVRHTELKAPCFRFSLALEHPRFGLVIRQDGVFEEMP